MAEAAVKPDPNEARDLLAQVPTELADLSRDGGGYKVQVIYLPDIETPETAHVTVLDEKGNVIDTMNVPAKQGLDVFRHPAHYSRALSDFLAGR